MTGYNDELGIEVWAAYCYLRERGHGTALCGKKISRVMEETGITNGIDAGKYIEAMHTIQTSLHTTNQRLLFLHARLCSHRQTFALLPLVCLLADIFGSAISDEQYVDRTYAQPKLSPFADFLLRYEEEKQQEAATLSAKYFADSIADIKLQPITINGEHVHLISQEIVEKGGSVHAEWTLANRLDEVYDAAQAAQFPPATPRFCGRDLDQLMQETQLGDMDTKWYAAAMLALYRYHNVTDVSLEETHQAFVADRNGRDLLTWVGKQVQAVPAWWIQENWEEVFV